MLTAEKIKTNYLLYCDKLKKYQCYSDELMNNYGEAIMNAPFSTNETSGGAYQGGLIDITLNYLCKTAFLINDSLGKASETEMLKCNPTMLMRVLLLQHLAKAVFFVPTRDAWKIKKGLYYEFSQDLQSKLKLGQRTLYMCQMYNITLTEDEYEAISSIDCTDAEKGDAFQTPLTALARSANKLTEVALRQKYLAENSATASTTEE